MYMSVICDSWGDQQNRLKIYNVTFYEIRMCSTLSKQIQESILAYRSSTAYIRDQRITQAQQVQFTIPINSSAM